MDEVDIEAAEKAKANQKAAVAFLKKQAKGFNATLSHNFVNGYFQLAAQDAMRLSEVLAVLAQIDVT